MAKTVMVDLANLAVPPEQITVRPGDTIRVRSSFHYEGPPMTGRFRTALYYSGGIDPHDEIVFGHLAFSIPDSPPPGVEVSTAPSDIDLVVPRGYSGTQFGLYTKLVDIPGPDIFSPYYDNVIVIERIEPVFSNLVIVSYSKV